MLHTTGKHTCSVNMFHVCLPSEPRGFAQPPTGSLGSGDAVPPGFRPPGYGGLQEPFPAGMGRSGGMHIGPDDPLFAGRSGMQRPGRPGMHPAGARFDPIGPPGMPVSLQSSYKNLLLKSVSVYTCLHTAGSASHMCDPALTCRDSIQTTFKQAVVNFIQT